MRWPYKLVLAFAGVAKERSCSCCCWRSTAVSYCSASLKAPSPIVADATPAPKATTQRSVLEMFDFVKNDIDDERAVFTRSL
jgi:hypothetical protein